MEFQSREPDEIIQNIKEKFNFRKPKNLSPLVIFAIIALIFVLKGAFYTIQPNEVGVVLRFGKFMQTTKPGLHFKIPFVEVGSVSYANLILPSSGTNKHESMAFLSSSVVLPAVFTRSVILVAVSVTLITRLFILSVLKGIIFLTYL